MFKTSEPYLLTIKPWCLLWWGSLWSSPQISCALPYPCLSPDITIIRSGEFQAERHFQAILNLVKLIYRPFSPDFQEFWCHTNVHRSCAAAGAPEKYYWSYQSLRFLYPLDEKWKKKTPHLLLHLLVNKSDEAKSFRLATAGTLLQLDHVDLTKWLWEKIL